MLLQHTSADWKTRQSLIACVVILSICFAASLIAHVYLRRRYRRTVNRLQHQLQQCKSQQLSNQKPTNEQAIDKHSEHMPSSNERYLLQKQDYENVSKPYKTLRGRAVETPNEGVYEKIQIL